MKLITTFLFILVASSTYRCKEPEDTINCKDAATQMIGVWKGKNDYSNGGTHNMTLTVTSSNNCFFQGISSFEESNTTFVVSGSIDKYGWVEFMETEYDVNGGEYTDCSPNGSSWNNQCNTWPTVRWRPGIKFNESRFRSNPYVLVGEFYGAGNGWRSSIRGTFTLSK